LWQCSSAKLQIFPEKTLFSPKNFDFGRKSLKKRVVVKQKNETAKGFAHFFAGYKPDDFLFYVIGRMNFEG